ncbi:MAG TPA: DUF1294 domain-containing protein [Anaerolineae bacterium]|nr:DUF1294 domain-containing protein [Anaerolineae bacterium]
MKNNIYRRYGVVVGGVVVVVTVLLGVVWSWVGAYLVAINGVTFLLYGYDKRQAGNGAGRVPERVLHLCALVGGSAGAGIGQQWWRHKRAKRPFQIVFWSIVAVQVLLVAGIYFLWM